MAMQKAEMEKMMRRGGTDPWAVDFNKNLEGKDIQNDAESLRDSAATIGEGAKFTF
tara:strand:- start:33 stop:200 length:168 start_codon:yes stop_codon:yes gene_type:complete